MSDEPKADELHITFSLPDVITIGVWDVYQAGKQAYKAQQERVNKPTTETVAQYYGALALIDGGFVHVTNAPDDLLRWLTVKERETTPLQIVWYVCQEVAIRIETAFFGTLPWVKAATSPNGSSPTS